MENSSILESVIKLTQDALSELLAKVWSNRNALSPQINAALSQLSFAFSVDESDTTTCIRLFIDAHYAEPLSLQSVAAHFFISPCYLSHLLARSGDGFSVYLQKARLNAAKALLCGSCLPVNIIAARTGFSTAGQFRRIFKRAVGCSPLTFRTQSASSLTSTCVSSMIGIE